MKIHSIFYLSIAILFVGCGETNQNTTKKSDYYSTRIDTSYNAIDRTKIDKIERYIYSYKSNRAKHSLSLSTDLKGRDDVMTYNIIKVNASDLGNIKSSILTFKNVAEVETFFSKVDALEIDTSLLERKKTKHYEINKGKRLIDINQFNGENNISNKMTLSTSEYDGIKSAFKKYLSENQ